MEYINQFQDCYAAYADGYLTIGNSRMERSWRMEGILPQSSTLLNKKTGKQWLKEEDCGQWVIQPEEQYAFFRQGITTGGMTVAGMETDTDNDLGIGETCFRVTVQLVFGGCRVDWIHLIYPELPVMRSFLRVSELTQIRSQDCLEEFPKDFTDCLTLQPMHMKWSSVRFTDKTDDYDNLVVETKGILTRRETWNFQGNLLSVRDILDGDGLTLIKEGPSVVGYLTEDKMDFLAKGMNLYTVGWGFAPELLRQGEAMTSYGSAVVVWDGTEEAALEALHSYNRAVRRFDATRDAQIMSNTWGDGNADGRICEEFLMGELVRAKELGVTYFQIDDGWEAGTTANSVNATADTAWGEGYYKSNPHFWDVNAQRLPNGLDPIQNYAQENGILLGLWFSPDAMNDYENWERDAEVLLNLHRKHNVTAFKMDGLIFHNKRGEENFGRMMRRVVEGSDGKVFFNLDTTASIRNGYFGRVQYGTLFLENRFTNPFGRWPNYYPHHTLRNLWMLSRYLPTERLQIEFLNVSNNARFYGDDPLSPKNWGQELAFAVTMFASPLAWMEMSMLKDEAAAGLKDAIAAYRGVQADILGGHVLPIGEEPDGISWTGFQSIGRDGSGYLLLIRELGGEDSHTLKLWDRKNCRLKLEPIAGSGIQQMVQLDEQGYGTFALNAPLSYGLYRYTTE